MRIKRIFCQTLQSLRVPELSRRLHQRESIILMFHGLTDLQHYGLDNCQHKHLHVKRFDAFLNHLKKHFKVIALEDLVRCLNAGVPPPPSSVVLTFDDGFLSNYVLGFPVLKKHGVPATIFLATEFVDENKPLWVDRVDYAFSRACRTKHELIRVKKRLKALPIEDLAVAVEDLERQLGFKLDLSNGTSVPAIYHVMDWNHVREMQESGLVSFGAHTHLHWILSRCPPDLVLSDVAKGKGIIERETGRPCTTFCYPNGGVGDFSDETERIIRGIGFESTITTVGGVNAPGCSPFLLKRFGITSDLDLVRFDMLTSGIDRSQR